MVFAGMRLGEEISEVGASGLPFYFEVVLANAVSYPMETHVDGFAALLLYRI